jgi:hypothetical protein
MITVAPHDLHTPVRLPPQLASWVCRVIISLSLSPATGSGVCRILLTLEFTSISIVRQSTIFFFLARWLAIGQKLEYNAFTSTPSCANGHATVHGILQKKGASCRTYAPCCNLNHWRTNIVISKLRKQRKKWQLQLEFFFSSSFLKLGYSTKQMVRNWLNTIHMHISSSNSECQKGASEMVVHAPSLWIISIKIVS